jgi:transcriptional regulator with XRE-family HTH domain
MIATKIVEGRTRKGLSQGDLAKISGVYKSTIQRYEKGVRPIRKNLEKIAKALGKPIEYFLQENEESTGNYKSNLPEKMKKVVQFSDSEQRAVEFVIDQILEKRRVLGDLTEIVSHAKR